MAELRPLDRVVDDDAVRFLGQAIHNLSDKLNRMESLLISADAKVGSLFRGLDELQRLSHGLDQKLTQALMSPEEKAAQLAKARDIVDKMKKEAEAELEMILKRRSERGVGGDGEKLTPAERAAWEAGHELPE